MEKHRLYFNIALLLGLVFHGATFFFTFEETYDAYVHIFFADHYASDWFSSWDHRWYTGFTTTSYPPLVHQLVALLSYLFGLKLAFYLWSIVAILLMIRGVYEFSKLWVSKEAAGIAAIAACFSGSIVEALHLFGQVPSLTGVALLLNATPYVYKYVRFNQRKDLILSILVLGATTAAHHVTTIFGMVFFLFPLIGVALTDRAIDKKNDIKLVKFADWLKEFKERFWSIVLFGFGTLVAMIGVIFSYWYWSKSDPISQVSIPHGSRSSFILEPDLGTVFFLIPWGIMLFFLPYFIYRLFNRRNIFLGISFCLLFLLGTGGTTPLPRMILGDAAFEILTLDRFTFWGSIMVLPFWGKLILELIDPKSSYKTAKKLLGYFLILSTIVTTVLILNIRFFRPFQPDEIDIKPIVNFLERDQHDQWRYLTLGFGDQMAWLSANTNAATVDGNYHSVRRLPELTTRSVERLENAKYRGMSGIGSLQDFLSYPDKYHLKYIFSNDKFYEPILFFFGWNKVSLMENNIYLWERPDVKPLPSVQVSKQIPSIQRIMWGTLPLLFLALSLLGVFFLKDKKEQITPIIKGKQISEFKIFWWIFFGWFISICTMVLSFLIYDSKYNNDHASPINALTAYYDAIDFKEFKVAYGLLDPETKPSFEQYMLELSLEDGILSSYAKLDAIRPELIDEFLDTLSTYKIETDWITSLNYYTKQFEKDLVKRKGKWYLKHNKFDQDIPPNQFFSVPELSFHNQGRRKANIEATDRADVLDRPNMVLYQGALIKTKQGLSAIGMVKNMDNVPAYISLDAILYDELGREIIQSSPKEILTRHLLPKEDCYFKIDFDSLSILLPEDKTQLVVFAKSLVSDQDVNKFYGIHNVVQKGNEIDLEVYNFGTDEISIPQLIFARYDTNGNLIWVDDDFLPNGIRPQRKKRAKINIQLPKDLNVLSFLKDDQMFVNGNSMDKFKEINKLEDQKDLIQLKLNAFIFKSE